jgi:hypothetical protein
MGDLQLERNQRFLRQTRLFLFLRPYPSTPDPVP